MDDWAWLGKAVALALFAGALVLLATSGGDWQPYGSPSSKKKDVKEKK